MPIDGVSALVSEAEDDRAWLIQNAQRQDVAEVEVEGHDNAAIGLRSLDKCSVRALLEADRAHVNGVVAQANQKVDGLRRDPGISQKSHRRYGSKG